MLLLHSLIPPGVNIILLELFIAGPALLSSNRQSQLAVGCSLPAPLSSWCMSSCCCRVVGSELILSSVTSSSSSSSSSFPSFSSRQKGVGCSSCLLKHGVEGILGDSNFVLVLVYVCECMWCKCLLIYHHL